MGDGIVQFITSLRPADLLDFLLVWVVVYRLLIITKSSGAYQILAGIGFVTLAFALSKSLDLLTLHWLLETFFSNIFIILVILFQGEIKRAFAQIGGNPFLLSKTRIIEESHVVEEISKGLFVLAQRGVGALVVIEREIELDHFIEMGTEVDSKVTSELIVSLFMPQSPLHDGALVIRGTKIYAAGCFLPLSKNSLLDKNLGTRHRAALGITEQTDAVVFVVSEESRSVGEAQVGQFHGDLDLAGVKHKILQAYDVSGKVKESRDK